MSNSTEEKKTEPTTKLYICELCSKTFIHYRSWWKHCKEKKTACIPQKDALKLSKDLEIEESRAHYFKTQLDMTKKELEKEKEEKEQLKLLMEKGIVQVQKKMDQVNDTLESGLVNVEKRIEQSSQQGFNNCVINQTLNENKNNKFNFNLAKPKKEKLDHISKADMMCLLNNKKFPETVGELMEIVYFNPNCPYNWSWCVTDDQAAFGVLEYCHESNSLIRKNTIAVIKKRLQYVLFGIGDIMEELRQTGSFNDRQGINYSRLYNMVGQDSFDADILKSIKERAYVGRGLSRALWKRLGMPIETTEIDGRVMLDKN